ncbi:MAG: EAL domain-containing protein [Pseudomonadota bacterium]
MKLPFQSLQSRIVFLFLTLILVVQFIGFVAIWVSINKNARVAIKEQLGIGEQVLRTVIIRRGENLTLSARILATDFGFRQAIASNDSETIQSALENSGSRIESDVNMLYSPEGVRQVVSGSLPANMIDGPIHRLIETAQGGGESFNVAVFDGVPYLLVAVPVKAPLTIAWIVTGFEIDDSWANRIQDVSLLEVSFITKINRTPSSQAQWKLSSSTMSKLYAEDTIAGIPNNWAQTTDKNAMPSTVQDTEVSIQGLDYGTRYVQLLNQDNQVLIAVLQRSIGESIAPYFSLQLNLLVLTILGAFVFVAGSVITAKRITQPLTKLVKTAELLEKGDYSKPILSSSSDEIGHLSRTFDRMREAVAEREHKISKLAYWDELTQLPNRAFFTDQLLKFSENYQQNQQTFSVLMMDLDRFKHVNDVLGHSAADQLLIGVAERLKQSCKSETDVVARLGGDEFGIILANTDAELALTVAKRLQSALETPIALNDSFVDLSAGVGIANYPEHAKNIEVLLSRAEIAMYAAKNSAGSVAVYHSGLDVANEENLSLVSEIKVAVEQNQLCLFVQPKIDFASGKLLAVEALVRWNHPERGMVFPDMFIPFAEQTGHIGKISYWMLSEAARYAAIWQNQGLDVAVAVNLSARDLIDIELPHKLKQILDEHQLKANSISLEITESSIMDDPERALETVERIAKMGIQLSIDDFGTGYSSLAYLKRLPVNELKIDRSFVMNIERDQDDVTIVKSTIELGHNLGLKVVAEGIENQKVWDILKLMGCDYGQGYFMSKPMAADKLFDWTEQWAMDHLNKKIA